MSQLSRKERERARHRLLILEAAEEVFAESGFHAAAMQAIAERAEFSVGYLYNLFESKADLYGQLMDTRAAQFVEDVQERIAAEQDVLSQVRAALEAKVDFFRDHRRFFRIFARVRAEDRRGGPHALPRQVQERYAGYAERLGRIFARGIGQGLFVDVDPMVLAQCMEGMTNAAIARWVIRGGKGEALAAPEVLERILFRGILKRESSE